MPFTIHPFRRFTVCCPVTYHAGLSEGPRHDLECLAERMVSVWRSTITSQGDLFNDIKLSNQQHLIVAGAIMRWVKGQEYGLKTLLTEKPMHCQLEPFVRRLVLEPAEVPHE